MTITYLDPSYPVIFGPQMYDLLQILTRGVRFSTPKRNFNLHSP